MRGVKGVSGSGSEGDESTGDTGEGGIESSGLAVSGRVHSLRNGGDGRRFSLAVLLIGSGIAVGDAGLMVAVLWGCGVSEWRGREERWACRWVDWVRWRDGRLGRGELG